MKSQNNTYKFLFFGLLLIIVSSGATYFFTSKSSPTQQGVAEVKSAQVEKSNMQIQNEPDVIASNETPFMNVQRRLSDKAVVSVTCQTSSAVECELIAVNGIKEKSLGKKMTAPLTDDPNLHSTEWSMPQKADAYYVITYHNGRQIGKSVQN